MINTIYEINTVRKFVIAPVAALCIAWGSAAVAETRYVTDELKVTLRRGESTGHKVIKMLPSGARVEVLSSNEKNGYAHVRTADGVEGYILSRMLKAERPARERLAAAEKMLEALRASPDKLRQQLTATRQELEQVSSAYNALQQEHAKLGREVANLRKTSANAVKTAAQRDKLLSDNAALTAQVEQLQRFKQNLQNDEFRRWFLIGAAVLFAGIVLGLIIPRMRRQRSSGFGSY